MAIEFSRQVFQPLGDDPVFGDAETWLDPRGRTLSQRVWLSRQEVRRQIDKRVRLALVNGEDPLVLARALEQYLDPSLAPVRNERGRLERFKRDQQGNFVLDEHGRRIPAQPKGGITRTPRGGAGSYPARRLARTEITRAFGQATIQAAQRNPFVRGVRWNLSARHPEPDECNDMARRDVGLGRGVYPAHDFPRYPLHPNELCYLSPVAVDDVAGVVAGLRREYGLDPQPSNVVAFPRPGGLRERVVALFRAARQLLGREAA